MLIFLAGVPAFFLTGNLADRVPYVPLLLSLLGGFVVCLVALTVVQGFLPILAVTLVLGYVIHSTFPAMDTFLLDSLPDDNRASAYAVYSGSMMLFQATGSVTVGTLVDAGMTYDAVFRSFAVVLVVVSSWSSCSDSSASTPSTGCRRARRRPEIGCGDRTATVGKARPSRGRFFTPVLMWGRWSTSRTGSPPSTT
jgi:MFS family permease